MKTLTIHPQVSSPRRVPPVPRAVRSPGLFLTWGRVRTYRREEQDPDSGEAQSWTPARGPGPRLTEEMWNRCLGLAEGLFSGGENKHPCVPAPLRPHIIPPLPLVCSGSALLPACDTEIQLLERMTGPSGWSSHADLCTQLEERWLPGCSPRIGLPGRRACSEPGDGQHGSKVLLPP